MRGQRNTRWESWWNPERSFRGLELLRRKQVPTVDRGEQNWARGRGGSRNLPSAAVEASLVSGGRGTHNIPASDFRGGRGI